MPATVGLTWSDLRRIRYCNPVAVVENSLGASASTRFGPNRSGATGVDACGWQPQQATRKQIQSRDLESIARPTVDHHLPNCIFMIITATTQEHLESSELASANPFFDPTYHCPHVPLPSSIATAINYDAHRNGNSTTEHQKRTYCSQSQFRSSRRVPLNTLFSRDQRLAYRFRCRIASSKIEGVNATSKRVTRKDGHLSQSVFRLLDREVLARLVAAAVFKTVGRRVNRVAGGFDSHALPLRDSHRCFWRPPGTLYSLVIPPVRPLTAYENRMTTGLDCSSMRLTTS